MHTKFGVPASSKLAHHIGCAQHTIFGVPCTLKLVCYAHHLVCHAHHTGVPCTPHWCAMHSIFGVHGTLVNCFIPPIPLYKHVIRNRIHKFCSSIYCLSSIHTNDDSIQGYQYVFLKHITVLVTTHKNHITYFKCLVTADTFQ